MIEIPENLRSFDRTKLERISEINARIRLKDYDPFIHKGNRGHLALIAGSKGMVGASLLSASSACKSGVGKLTVFAPESSALPIHLYVPDALVKFQHSNIDLSYFDAVAIGPGLGTTTDAAALLKKTISHNKPMVIDADALNLIGMHMDFLYQLPKNAILTPHLKEWQRIFGTADSDKERIITSIDICKKLNINILIKGHVSVLVNSNGEVFYNATGNAGMAKGGSGDILTGIIGSFLAQGYHSTDAAILGMYLHGLSGDLAKQSIGEDAMTASDQIFHFSEAFKRLRNSRANP